MKGKIFTLKSISLILILVLSSVILSGSSMSDTMINHDMQQEMDKAMISQIGQETYDRMIEQIPALEAYQEIYESFKDNKGTIHYPEGYAGEFIDGSNLIVCFKNNSDTSFLNAVDNVLIEYVSHSNEELTEYTEKILSVSNNRELFFYDIDPRKNSVNIFADSKDLCYVIEEYISSVSLSGKDNVPDVSFHYGFPSGKTQVDLYGGQEIANSNGSGFTLGFCGTYYGDDAIVTCGHSQSTTYNLVINSGTRGTFEYVRFSNNNYGDFSIAEITDANYNITNDVKYSYGYRDVTGVLLDPPIGTLLCRYGKETGYQCVEVTGRNWSITVDGIVTLGMTRAEHVSGTKPTDGDSGGPLYALSYGSTCSAAGVHQGSSLTDDDYIHFTPAGDIISGFSFKIN